MAAPNNFRTSRLDLRKPQLGDAKAILEEYAQDTQVVRFLVWRPHRSVDDTRTFLSGCLDNWHTGVENTWVITLVGHDRAIGMISARRNGSLVELGYVLARRVWGQGLMAEAAGTVTEWGLSENEINRVQALCDVDNVASARVMEKIGMRQECIIRRCTIHPNISPDPRNCFLYAKVRPAGRRDEASITLR